MLIVNKSSMTNFDDLRTLFIYKMIKYELIIESGKTIG